MDGSLLEDEIFPDLSDLGIVALGGLCFFFNIEDIPHVEVRGAEKRAFRAVLLGVQ